MVVIKIIGEVCNLLSGFECDVVVLPSIAPVDFLEVESVGEEIVDEGAEGHAVGPRRREILYFDPFVFADATLTPNENGLHLRRHHLAVTGRPRDAQFQGHAGVSRHAAAFGVPERGKKRTFIETR